MNYKSLPSKVILFCGIFLTSANISFCESNLDFFFGESAKYKKVIVKEVLNTDKIRLESGEIIKLIGLRAEECRNKNKRKKPERDEFGFTVKEQTTHITPVGEKAFKYVKNLLEKNEVRLEFDTEKKDSKYNTLAYVFLLKKNIFVNAEILRLGFAHLQIKLPNKKYAKELREAYREARREQRGLQNK